MFTINSAALYDRASNRVSFSVKSRRVKPSTYSDSPWLDRGLHTQWPIWLIPTQTLMITEELRYIYLLLVYFLGSTHIVAKSDFWALAVSLQFFARNVMLTSFPQLNATPNVLYVHSSCILRKRSTLKCFDPLFILLFKRHTISSAVST